MADSTDIARLALTHNTINRASFDSSKVPNAVDMTFSTHEEEVVDQKSTGTCWLQAGMTFLSALARRNGINVRFSLTHLIYHDKLGKAQAFMRRYRETLESSSKESEKSKRVRWHLLKEPITDGGTWGMFIHLIKTYGVVPHDSRLPMRQAVQTSQINKYLNDYLRKQAFLLEEAMENDRDRADELMGKTRLCVEDALLRAYGFPSDQVTLVEKVHGRDFIGESKELCSMIRTHWCYTVLTDAPDRHKPNHQPKRYIGPETNDAQDLSQDRFLVVDMNDIVRATIEQLKYGIPVWFTCEVSFDFCPHHGVATAGIYNTDLILNLTCNTDDAANEKENRMKTQRISPAHAMLLTGVKLQDGKPTHWRIQNSWGTEHEYGKGFLTADHKWFQQYVFQVAIDDFFLGKVLAKAKAEEEKLQPWDIFATVAHSSIDY